MNKKVILKIVFLLTFIPYVVLLVLSIHHAIFGYREFTLNLSYEPKIYGWDAFLDVFLLYGIIFCYIPVFPVCFLYQIIYFLEVIKKRK